MTILVHAGYLKKAEENYTIRGGAVALFFKHRDDVIEELKIEDPDNVDYYEAIPQGSEIKDRDEFPTFHINWIDGIVTSCLKVLNRKPCVAGDILLKDPTANNAIVPASIYDPHYVYDYSQKSYIDIFDYPPPPVPPLPLKPPLLAKDINTLKVHFDFSTKGKLAYDQGIAATEFQLLDQLSLAAYTPIIPAILTAPSSVQYSKPEPKNFIPVNASEEFKDLEFDTELSLPDKQSTVAIALINSLDELVTELKKYPNSENYLENIAKSGLNEAIEKLLDFAENILEKNFPEPKVEQALTTSVNYKALIGFLQKPLILSAIGVIFGSSENGFTGMMKKIQPDAIGEYNDKPDYPDPTPTVLNFSEDAEPGVSAPAKSGGDYLTLTDISLEEAGNTAQTRKDIEEFKFSTPCLRWLAIKEGGVRYDIYDDGIGLPTTAMGHLLVPPGSPQMAAWKARVKEILGEEKVYRYFVKDLQKYQVMVRKNVRALEQKRNKTFLWTQYEYDVMVMWAWGFGSVPPKLLAAAVDSPSANRKSPYWLVADEIVTWTGGTNSEGQKVTISGIAGRRKMEAVLWEQGDYNAVFYVKSIEQALADSKSNAYKGLGAYDQLDYKLSDNSKTDFKLETILPKVKRYEDLLIAEGKSLEINADIDILGGGNAPSKDANKKA